MRIFILSPHTDDGEFGCGATIAKFIEEGHNVYYIAFSSAGKSVPSGFPHNILQDEVRKATEVLGIKSENLMLFNYEVREFPSKRQAILDDIIRLEKEFKPDLVFLPTTYDTHQDHQVIINEGFRALKGASMLGFEIPHNNLSFSTDVFIQVSEAQLQTKIKATGCYKSQSHKSYSSPSFIKSLAVVRGAQVGVEFAETFEGIRQVIK